MHRSIIGRRLTGFGFIAVALAATASSSYAQSLLTNGDFETDAPHYGATGWSVFNDAYTSNEYAHGGSLNSFKIFGPFGDPGGGAGGNQTVSATPGQTYQFTGFALSPAGDHLTGNNFALAQIKFFNGTTELTAAEQSARFDATMSGSVTDWTPFSVIGTAPANATNVQVQLVHVQQNTPPSPQGGAIFWDDLSLVQLLGEPTYALTGSGDFNTTSSFTGGVPNGVGAIANFKSSITADATVTANQAETLGTLRFDNAHSYTLSGTGSLTLDVASGQASVEVNSGSHTINIPVTLNDSTTATVASGATLTLAKPVTIGANLQFTTAGAGTVVTKSTVTGGTGSSIAVTAGTLRADADLGSIAVSATGGSTQFAASQHLLSLSVGNGASASLNDVATRTVLRTGPLAVAGTGKLDINDNGLIVDYSGTSPLATIRGLIVSGYNAAGTHWTGNGITSTNAAGNANRGIGYAEANTITNPFTGETVDSTTVIVRYTLLGDSNLDGAVDFSDLLSLAKGYGQAGTWVKGDSNYDNTVDFSDLLALAKNYGGTLSAAQVDALGSSFAADFAAAQSLVPEPTSALALVAAGAAMTARRRQRAAIV